MSQTVNVNFKLDAEVKKSMEQACADMGLSMSAAFTVFAKKVGRERRIPFEITADPFYSDTNVDVPNAVTRETIEKANRGEDLYGPFDSVAEMMRVLNA